MCCVWAVLHVRRLALCWGPQALSEGAHPGHGEACLGTQPTHVGRRAHLSYAALAAGWARPSGGRFIRGATHALTARQYRGTSTSLAPGCTLEIAIEDCRPAAEHFPDLHFPARLALVIFYTDSSHAAPPPTRKPRGCRCITRTTSIATCHCCTTTTPLLSRRVRCIPRVTAAPRSHGCCVATLTRLSGSRQQSCTRTRLTRVSS